MKDKEDILIYNLYSEGIFDRVGARITGIGNTKFFGGTGYNKGKAIEFESKLKNRISKDIDKFLKDVVTMAGLSSIADFTAKYPELANKVKSMANAIGHSTPL